jgi:hypothetical protein
MPIFWNTLSHLHRRLEPNLFPYKYPNILHHSYSSYLPAYEDGTDRVFRNIGIRNSDARELPRGKHTAFRTRRKFEIKNLEIRCLSVVKYASDLMERHGWVGSPVLCSNDVTRTLLFCVMSPSPGFCEHPCCCIGCCACPLWHVTDLPTQRSGRITVLNELESQ